MEGFVSLTEKGDRVPVTILRDTAASQSFMLSHVLPFSEESAGDSGVLVRGFGMQYLEAPLHTIYLKSDLVTGFVTVGVCPCFPIEGVSFILGNDLAGGKVLVKPGGGDPGKEGKEPVAYGHAGENTDANPFAEYMWMENEEEYNGQVEELLEREFLERCFQEMLEEEDQDWFIPSRDLNKPGGGQQLNGLSANDHHSNLEEVARKSILNPEAKEFIPAGIMLWPMCCCACRFIL
ncbi:uncharacterized protein LOC133425392 [Cololabis saira]|uniref:uncharacterized protein LOC133425392 n=1 Tax=Cololabis saira TaxID=129043 RepID=UPI002AD43998|nr:uncharacterized protein LOC133425392 [Cololabis saira]